MRLRIVAGSLGGRFIEAPPDRGTRPTAERVREAWFSALGDRVRDASAADLFAGSGALGIEALSRGARSVDFVESDRRSAEVLRENLCRLGLVERATLHRCDVFRFLGRDEAGGARYDLALADPPYGGSSARRLAETFRSLRFARLLCLEHAPGALEGPEGIEEEIVWSRRYGDTALTFLAASGEGSTGPSAPAGLGEEPSRTADREDPP